MRRLRPHEFDQIRRRVFARVGRLRALAELAQPCGREPDRFGVEVVAEEPAASLQGRHAHAAGPHERIGDRVARLRALANQDLGYPDRLFSRVAAMHTRDRQHVRNTQIVQAPLALLEEEDELVARTIVVAHADGALVPDQRLPELEAGLFGLRLGDEHRFGIAEQVEMRVAPEHAVGFGEQLAEARVREDPEPVVARGLAVLEPRRRADGAVLLERFVGRIRDQQIDRFRGLVLQPAHGVQV